MRCWCSRGRQWPCPFAQLEPLHTLPRTEPQCQCRQPPLHACTCHNASTVLHHQSHVAVLPPCTTTIPTCHGHSLLVFRIAHTPYHTVTHTLTDSSHPSHPPLSTTTMHTFATCAPLQPRFFKQPTSLKWVHCNQRVALLCQHTHTAVAYATGHCGVGKVLHDLPQHLRCLCHRPLHQHVHTLVWIQTRRCSSWWACWRSGR